MYDKLSCMRNIILPVLTIIIFLLLKSTVHAVLLPYHPTRIISNSLSIECIKISNVMEIVNRCPQTLYLNGERILGDVSDNEGDLWGYMFGKFPFDKVGIWEIYGKFGSQPVVIKGETLPLVDPNSRQNYDPFSPSFIIEGIVNIFIVLSPILLFYILVKLIIHFNQKYHILSRKNVLMTGKILLAIGLIYCLILITTGRIFFDNSNGPLDIHIVRSDGYNSQLSLAGTGIKKACRLIKDSKLQQICNAISEGTPSVCYQFVKDDLFNWCIRKIAIKQKQPELCNNIPDADVRDYCFSNVAEVRREPKLCGNIKLNEYQPHIMYQDRCLVDMAYRSRDTNICECIKTQRDYEDCRLNIEGGSRYSKDFTRANPKPNICN